MDDSYSSLESFRFRRVNSMRSLLLLAILNVITCCASASAQTSHSRCDSKPCDSKPCDHSSIEGGSCDQLGCDGLAGRHSDVEYGRKIGAIDSLGWIVGVPRKLMLWDRKVDNHSISSHTTSAVSQYLSDRGLSDVKLRVNQYDPIGEWKRLVQNKRMSPGWKYTAGVLRTAEYTFLPGRIFGRDEYNPFTNTVSTTPTTQSWGWRHPRMRTMCIDAIRPEPMQRFKAFP
jgi:hypothetical protein